MIEINKVNVFDFPTHNLSIDGVVVGIGSEAQLLDLKEELILEYDKAGQLKQFFEQVKL